MKSSKGTKIIGTFAIAAVAVAEIAIAEKIDSIAINTDELARIAFAANNESSYSQIFDNELSYSQVFDKVVLAANNESSYSQVFDDEEAVASSDDEVIVEESGSEAEGEEETTTGGDGDDKNSKRGSAANRFRQSAEDNANKASENDIANGTLDEETQKILDNLTKSDMSNQDPTIGQTDEGKEIDYSELNNIDPVAPDDDLNVGSKNFLFIMTGIVASAAVSAATAIGVVAKKKSNLRKYGTRLIQNDNNVKKPRKLSRVSEKIKKKQEKGKEVSTRLQKEHDDLSKVVEAKSIKVLEQGFNSRRLAIYARWAKVRKNKDYFNDAFNKKTYVELNKFLATYANYLKKGTNSQSARNSLSKAITSLNKIVDNIPQDVYFGEFAYQKNSKTELSDVNLSQIPVFPFRYVQNQNTEILATEKADLECFFNQVFAVCANNEENVTYGTINYKVKGEEDTVSKQIKYAFDNNEAIDLIRSKLLTLLPENVETIQIIENNGTKSPLNISYASDASIRNAKNNAQIIVDTFERRNETSQDSEQIIEESAPIQHEIFSNNGRDEGLGM